MWKICLKFLKRNVQHEICDDLSLRGGTSSTIVKHVTHMKQINFGAPSFIFTVLLSNRLVTHQNEARKYGGELVEGFEKIHRKYFLFRKEERTNQRKNLGRRKFLIFYIPTLTLSKMLVKHTTTTETSRAHILASIYLGMKEILT